MLVRLFCFVFLYIYFCGSSWVLSWNLKSFFCWKQSFFFIIYFDNCTCFIYFALSDFYFCINFVSWICLPYISFSPHFYVVIILNWAQDEFLHFPQAYAFCLLWLPINGETSFLMRTCIGCLCVLASVFQFKDIMDC